MEGVEGYFHISYRKNIFSIFYIFSIPAENRISTLNPPPSFMILK